MTNAEEKLLDEELSSLLGTGRHEALSKTYWKLMCVRTARRHLQRQLIERRGAA